MQNKFPKSVDSQNIAENQVSTDLNDFDRKKIEKFQEDGLPGMIHVTESMVARMMDLYLSGKPYTQIARLMRVEKPLVLYLSDKFNWYGKRSEYLVELDATLTNRLIESKITNKDFLLRLSHSLQKKIGKKLDLYLSTGEESHMDGIDLKELDKYLKTVESLQKLSADPSPKKPSAPTVGLNLGDGVTIKKKNDNEVEITPKQKSIEEMLQQFADFRREENSKKEAQNKSDIKESNEGESSNES